MSSHHCGALTGTARPLSVSRVASWSNGDPAVWPKPTETMIGWLPAVRQTNPPVACAGTASASSSGATRSALVMKASIVQGLLNRGLRA